MRTFSSSDRADICGDLDSRGCAVLRALLVSRECRSSATLYAHESHCRSRIVTSRHGFGRGEYQYKYPPPPLLAELRAALYRGLAPTGNQWAVRLRERRRYPPISSRFLGTVTLPVRHGRRRFS